MRRVKMHLKCMEILVLLCVFHGTLEVTIKDKDNYQITCTLRQDPSLTVMWLRATKENGVEFLVSSKNKKYAWGTETLKETIETADGWKLTIKSFNKQTDSGIYNCATYNANKLEFGRPTVIEGTQDSTPPPPPKTTKTPARTTNCTAAASTPCVCPNQRVKGSLDPEKRCELMIWVPLAGGCGLLFVFLIAVSLYCNRMRTRRCPHHHKRQPRPAGGMRHPESNRYV